MELEVDSNENVPAPDQSRAESGTGMTIPLMESLAGKASVIEFFSGLVESSTPVNSAFSRFSGSSREFRTFSDGVGVHAIRKSRAGTVRLRIMLTFITDTKTTEKPLSPPKMMQS